MVKKIPCNRKAAEVDRSIQWCCEPRQKPGPKSRAPSIGYERRCRLRFDSHQKSTSISRALAAADQERESSMSRKRNRGLSLGDRPVEQPCAAGIDIGAREIFVAVHHDPDEKPVRRFSPFTEDLERMADWLERCGVTTVAMESTGVYWIALYEILDRRGLKPCVVNARHRKNVPGRRTDWHECQWIQFLHAVGLLRAAFRPEDQVCAVRAILRHRQQLVDRAAARSAHAEIPHADESADPACHQRYHRNDRPRHHRRDPRRLYLLQGGVPFS